ncbi:phenylalanyl-tRNA synthetase beta subunit [Streptoalloteichus tenebrarius]|uniref:Phenylalanine--tRNA ligase beta subunit n=1 Tax=Streptoalloteichus tenebrarius (strain ATCC 17920 / DSM 40477 / JCM 4838 / CBS 697.72 / NBRC 16177 / NCIMB 11028 / NRRL B-12390 / A12253. 1 / ISP 5477) TaxID=1933 RepID=A0ABT1HSH4_STRSD|nr:phenylalanine--tRNA ligase subunit beta [Streptoalloteichus tenebrarius]MCP2258480.1 phenylalanyl-tRNA synthetase beta subunit [Streptoalloteichus tenebrarius]BFF03652.1 phenylalanine--tRNA ligase subunit beta [Streptoalloteichus tenebrarius]
MRIPVSWLGTHLQLPEDVTAQQLADAFVRIGLEVEGVHPVGPVTGPLVVARVAEIEELTGFKKPIRFCRVEVGPDGADDSRGIVCGATNFREGDLVVVALPGAVLPGDFKIASRKTYGRISDGMICSARELGLGDEHAGILVLPTGTAGPGDDATELLGLDDSVIELSITPDRGYCFSVRGLARELACALDLPYGDPAAIEVPEADGDAHQVRVEDPVGCRRFVMRRVCEVDPTAPTPWWMRRRLMLAGIRSISLAVDVTNYVMLETGQPLHAFDANLVKGELVVRRAVAGEKLTTLDGVERVLDPDDLVICDDTGPVSLAGTMGGASTEIGSDSTEVLLEAATWEPATIARMVRRHKLPSEAAKRFERGVDPALPPAAAEMAAQLLVRYGDGRFGRGRTDVGEVPAPTPITMPLALPDRVAGVRYERGATARRLGQIGCRMELTTADDGTALVTAIPPSWRPDLTQPADLVEEVLRLEGYDTIPSTLPPAPAGRGLTEAQRRRRAVARALANAGYVEVLPFPFTGPGVWDAFGLPADDVRRRTAKVLNPMEPEKAELTTTLLPGLLEALQRNVARGQRDVALFHIGQVVLPRAQQVPVPDVGVAGRPSDEELASLDAALPRQPTHVAVVLAGNREQAGWWGKGRAASWADAVEAARVVAGTAGVELRVVSGDLAPWHPGRCAELRVGDAPVGHAGELHPKVVEALGLPPRTCAMELDLDLLPLVERRPAPVVSPYPPVLLDIALVLDEGVPVAEVADAVRSGGGALLEDVRLFDVYQSEQLGEGKRSLAFALRFRAPDRTLTVEEATEARDAAVAAASERFGATLRA